MATVDGLSRSELVGQWHQLHAREYAWRSTEDAWLVFLAEFLLRRTRADQVQAIISELVKAFPTPGAMAGAAPSEVREALRSVGLTHRIDQLHMAAKQIVDYHGGYVPEAEEELLDLSGVGPYVSRAVAARLGSQGVVLVDTNTVRVSIRVLGVEPRTKDPRRETGVIQAVCDLYGGPAPIELWWATIDLAHQICRPRSPDCGRCPLERRCEYSSRGRESDSSRRYAANE